MYLQLFSACSSNAGRRGLHSHAQHPGILASIHKELWCTKKKKKWGKGRETHLLDKISAQQRVDFTQEIWKAYNNIVKEKKQKTN